MLHAIRHPKASKTAEKEKIKFNKDFEKAILKSIKDMIPCTSWGFHGNHKYFNVCYLLPKYQENYDFMKFLESKGYTFVISRVYYAITIYM